MSCIPSLSVIPYELSVVVLVGRGLGQLFFKSLGLIISVTDSQLGLVLLCVFLFILSLGVSGNLAGKAGPCVRKIV